MKKALLLLLSSAIAALAHAQTALPYYTGFDNATEKAGWMQFRKGMTIYFDWVVGSGMGVPSAPNTLHHDYPVGSSGTDTTTDWYVSPPFKFPDGGKIDSFSIRISGIAGTPWVSDSLDVYLLKRSNNPSLATGKIRLASLSHMMGDLSSTYRDTGNFVIPADTGTVYLAFKYQTTVNWFVVDIDNIHVSKNAAVPPPHTGLTSMDESAFCIFPDPADRTLRINAISTPGIAAISLYDISGRKQLQLTTSLLQPVDIDVSHLAPGNYIADIAIDGKSYKQQVIIHH